MKRYSLFALMIVLIVLTTSCNYLFGKLTRADMVGVYQVNYNPYGGVGFGKEILTLNVDGTFEQTFTPTGGKPVHNKGSWTFDGSVPSNPELYLKDHVEYLEGGDKVAKKPVKSGSHTTMYWTKRWIKIIINEDQGEYYEKSR